MLNKKPVIDQIDARSEARDASIDARAEVRADQIDLRTAARDDIADVEQEARDDRIDARSEARDASIDARADVRADQIDLRTAARDDIADARQAARDSQIDARQKARDDQIDLRTAARDNITDAEVSAGDDRIDTRQGASDDNADARQAARDDIADAEVSAGDDRIDTRQGASDDNADARQAARDDIADAQIDAQDSGTEIFADALLTAGVDLSTSLENAAAPMLRLAEVMEAFNSNIAGISAAASVGINEIHAEAGIVRVPGFPVGADQELFHDPQNDLLAFRAGQQAARGTSRAFSPNQTQRENAADFSHHFGAGFTSGGQAQPESQGSSDRPMIIQLHLNDRVVQEMFLRGAELIGQDRLLFNPLRGV